jgi:hypothetical protein
MFISKTNKNEINFKRKSNPLIVRDIYINNLYDKLTLYVYKLYFDVYCEIDLDQVKVEFKFVKHPIHTIRPLFGVKVEVVNEYTPI